MNKITKICKRLFEPVLTIYNIIKKNDDIQLFEPDLNNI